MKFFKCLSLCLLFFATSLYAQRANPDQIETSEGMLTVQPIQHGTLVLSWNGQDLYIDPTGGASVFEGLESPDMVLITHAHGDHMDPETLEELDTEGVTIVVPQSVADELPEMFSNQLVILDNGENANQTGINIKAVPMYNLPESDDSYHPKGWGNGYVLTLADKRVYISGDTEGIPEMRSLKNIDVAFVCMNLPYTMDVEQASDAVLDFAPNIVYPYHYRGQDTEEFRQMMVDENGKIEVRLRNWYPER